MQDATRKTPHAPRKVGSKWNGHTITDVLDHDPNDTELPYLYELDGCISCWIDESRSSARFSPFESILVHDGIVYHAGDILSFSTSGAEISYAHWQQYRPRETSEFQFEDNSDLLAATLPQFTHDCESCIFLGRFQNHDLYYCNVGNKTVLARYGDWGWEYASGLEFINHHPELTEAARRAVALGLIHPEHEIGESTVGDELDLDDIN